MLPQQRVKHSLNSARSYTYRKPEKHRAEMQLIARAFGDLEDVRYVLDAPCGVGRATIWFASNGYRAMGVDLGEGAVAVAKTEAANANIEADILKADISNLPFGNQIFDATLCFRFIHHFQSEAFRDAVIQELCRVSKRYVLISYLSPWSITSLRRSVKRNLLKKPERQYAISLASLSAHFASQGFSLNQNYAQSQFLHSLHLAVFQRVNAM
jgi:SAM-dependent methyltransferase